MVAISDYDVMVERENKATVDSLKIRFKEEDIDEKGPDYVREIIVEAMREIERQDGEVERIVLPVRMRRLLKQTRSWAESTTRPLDQNAEYDRYYMQAGIISSSVLDDNVVVVSSKSSIELKKNMVKRGVKDESEQR